MNFNSFALAERHLHTIILTQGVPLEPRVLPWADISSALQAVGCSWPLGGRNYIRIKTLVFPFCFSCFCLREDVPFEQELRRRRNRRQRWRRMLREHILLKQGNKKLKMKDEKLKFINDYMLHLLMNINSFALAGRHLHTIILTQGVAL